jgi:transcriptional regulator with GAF, ATPase, and Fis domain
MNEPDNHASLLNKILDQLIQLFELSSRIDAKTERLDREQQALKQQVDQVVGDHHDLCNEIQNIKLTASTLKFISDTDKTNKEKIVSYTFKVLIVILTGVVSFIMYYLFEK